MTRSLLGIEMPIIQAPMAGAQGSALAIAVCNAGGWARCHVRCFRSDAMRAELAAIRAATRKPFNVNFFCHTPPTPNRDRQAAWRAALAPYYKEYGHRSRDCARGAVRAPFTARGGSTCSPISGPRSSVSIWFAGKHLLKMARSGREDSFLRDHG